MRLSLLIPTIGRRTALEHIFRLRGIEDTEDEVIFIGDGPNPLSGTFRARSLESRIRYFELPIKVGDYGCSACDYGIQQAQGDYIFFNGDDDITQPEAFDIIREGVKTDPTVPHLFAMEHTGRILKNSLECGQVSGQQIVIPRDMSKMPKMADFPPGQVGISDYYFIKHCEQAWGKIICHNEVIATLPRMNQGRML